MSDGDQRGGDGRTPTDKDGPADTPGGIDQERVEDRPNVSQVTPEDYPKDLPDH